ncbi:hypothetical protein Ahy_B10g103846 isoform A [Arachis hypogaea]|uniref:Uncharacterized protein n=1 Tax=Arachis hypogaea TaxID=3818 RepID=A0A444X484_ARAHY|nr:hypothetical protein Ahy_B10g103846 isoform A [Arachis hypogaea]
MINQSTAPSCIHISAISKVVNPESAYLSIASTAPSLSILPHPPLVCHIPLTTRHISNASFPFLTTILCLSSVSTHWHELTCLYLLAVAVPFPVKIASVTIAVSLGFSTQQEYEIDSDGNLHVRERERERESITYSDRPCRRWRDRRRRSGAWRGRRGLGRYGPSLRWSATVH